MYMYVYGFKPLYLYGRTYLMDKHFNSESNKQLQKIYMIIRIHID